jgi:hypothetical protein
MGFQHAKTRRLYQCHTVPPVPCIVMSMISKRKDKRFDIEAYYRNESKTFWFGPLTIGTKAKHTDLVQKKFFSVLAQKLWDEAKQFNLVWKLS